MTVPELKARLELVEDTVRDLRAAMDRCATKAGWPDTFCADVYERSRQVVPDAPDEPERLVGRQRTESDDLVTVMRGMYAEARLRFREMAEPLIDRSQVDDVALLAQVESLAAAIGEISPEEAMAALVRWDEHRAKPSAP